MMSDMFRRRRPTSTTIGSSSGERPPREEDSDCTSIKRMLDDASPSGRLPALTPTSEERKKRAAWSEKWKKLVRGKGSERKPPPPIYEPSRYTDTDDEDDS